MSMTSIDKSEMMHARTGTRLGHMPGWSFLMAIPKALMDLLAYRALRMTIAELNALDDRTLKDIGLSRGDIRWVVMDATSMPRARQPERRLFKLT